MVTTSKQKSTYRLTPVAMRLITQLAERLGQTRTGVLELAVRELAIKYDIEVQARGK